MYTYTTYRYVLQCLLIVINKLEIWQYLGNSVLNVFIYFVHQNILILAGLFFLNC